MTRTGSWMRRIRRVVLFATGLALVPAVGLLVVAIALRTPWVQAEVRDRVAALLGGALGARVSIGELRGTLLAGLRARDVRIAFPNGARLAAADLSATYALPALLAGQIAIGTVRVRGARIRLVHTAEGWGLGASGDEPGEGRLPVVGIRRILIEDGRLALAMQDATPPRKLALTALRLEAALAIDPTLVRVTVGDVAAVPRGIDLSPLSASAAIEVEPDGGAIRIDGLRLATRRSRLAGAARLAPGRRVDARLEASPLSARELRAVLPGSPIADDVRGSVVARGPWRRLPVRAALAVPRLGRARLFAVVDAGSTQLRWAGAARVRHVDLAAIDPTLPSTDLNGRVRGAGVLATLDPPLSLRLRLAPSVVASQRVEGAHLRGRVGGDGLTARGTITAPAGRVALDGRLEWTPALAYQARVRGRVDDLAALAPGVPGSGRLEATVEGRGADPVVRGRVTDARIAGIAVDEVVADLARRGDVLELRAGTAMARGLSADASGTLVIPTRALDARVTVAGDVGPAARSAGVDAGGAATVRASARGRLGALAIDATVAADRLHLPTVAATRLTASAQLTDVGSTAAGGRLELQVAGLTVAADTSPWTGNATADWRRGPGADVVAVTARGARADDSRVALAGTVRRPAAGEITLDLGELRIAPRDQPVWSLAAPARAVLRDQAVAIDRLELASASQRLRLAGRAARTGPVQATGAWQAIDLAWVCSLRGLSCAGRSSGTVTLSGSAGDPRVALELDAGGLVVEGSPSAAVSATGTYERRALRVRGSVSQADAGRLEVTALVPVDLRWDGPRADLSSAPVDVALTTTGLDLRSIRLLAPDAIRQSAGRLDADVRLTGRRDDLQAGGRVALRGGRLGLAATGVTYEDIEMELRGRGETLELERLTARAGAGTLEGSGTMALLASRTTPFAVRLDLRNFLAISQPGYEAATDGMLSIEGALAYPVVRGELVLTRLLVRPTLLAEFSGPSLEPDPTIEVVGLPTSASAAAPAPPIDAAEALSLDVGIRIVRDAWIRRADADVELRGELRVGKAPHRPPVVTGEIRLVRGWYAFQGRRFAIDEGRIVFAGDAPPDPQLDISALFRSGEYEVTVRITGRASEPTLALSSEPALEQADILSLLVFGRPARELGREQSFDLRRQAVSLASGYVAPELRESLQRTLGLDTIELGDKGVTAGRYVTRDVFVTLAQDFTGRAGQVVGVEYSVTRRLSLKLSTSTQGNSAVDVLWRRRY